jgi:hypothetical protein
MTKTFRGVFLVMILLAVCGTAYADINGQLWKVPEAIANAATIANVPGGAADVTFDVASPFNFSATSATVATWLASSSAYNLVENTPGTLASLMDNSTTGTLVRFTGFVSVINGQSFTVTHDDGLTLIIGGVDLGFNPGPTSPVVTTATYTGPSGNLPFELVYGECCGGPAVLQVDLPFTAAPEPGILGLVGANLLLLGGVFGVVRRFRKG